MNLTDWMSSASKQRWWSLRGDHMRVAMTLVAMAEVRGPDMVVETTGEHLAERCALSRTTVRRLLSGLAEAGFCAVTVREGRGGTSTVVIAGLGQLNSSQSQSLNKETLSTSASIPWPVKSLESGQSQAIEMVCVSLADLGDRGQLNRSKVASFDVITGQNATDLPIFPRASDQDLLRSPKTLRSDLRSSDLEILSKYVPTLTEQKEETMNEAQEAATTAPSDDTEPESPGKPKTRRRVDATKIPERAWAAADYLRRQVMAKNGAAVAGMKPWAYGWSWETGKANRTGDGSRTGLRLDWANSFRLFQEVLRGALKQGSQPSTDEHAWGEIAKTVHWLFHSQPSGVGFVVESPASLIKKWDRIQEVRTSSAKSKPSGYSDSHNGATVRPKLSASDDQEPTVSLFKNRAL